MTRLKIKSLTGGRGSLPPELAESAMMTRLRRQASYERCRVQVAESLRLLMKDLKLTDRDMAMKMGMPVQQVREMISSDDLTISQLSRLADVMSHDVYFLLRPRKPWTHT